MPLVDRNEGGTDAIRLRLPRTIYAPLLRLQDFITLAPTAEKRSGES
jgi:hypothetical protein